MRWPSRADKREVVTRERFSTPLAAVGIFCSFLLLLALLYPEQGLLGILTGGDDAATIRYREAVLRVRPADTELRLRVAGSLVRSGSSRRALEVLDGHTARLTAPQRHTAAELRYVALKHLFSQIQPGSAEWRNLQPRVAAAARDMAGPTPPAWQLRDFAADALKAGDRDAWREYLRQAEASENVGKAGPVSDDPVVRAMARGDYRTAAAAYFDQMKRAGTIARRRELFMQAVRTLQAGNLPREAFDAGEQHLGSLASDRATLIFLTKAGLAAGQPARSQILIRRALGTESPPSPPGSS